MSATTGSGEITHRRLQFFLRQVRVDTVEAFHDQTLVVEAHLYRRADQGLYTAEIRRRVHGLTTLVTELGWMGAELH